MGPKVGFGGAKVGEKWVKTHFSPTLNPFRDFRETPFVPSMRRVEIVFWKGRWGSPDQA